MKMKRYSDNPTLVRETRSVLSRVPRIAWWISGGLAAGGLVYFLFGRRRTPKDILNAVAEIDPEHNPELQPGAPPAPPGGTWCNKFIYQLMTKLHVPFIEWGPYGTLVNDMIAWVDAGNGGWFPVADRYAAQALALQGKIAIATYFNLSPGDHGHIAIVLPIPGSPVQTAQAGATNFNQGTIGDGFGSIQPIFYGHE